MPPLKKAPSSMLMRAAVTSPVSAPSARMSTRSEAEILPRTLPNITISRAAMLDVTWPLRPTVTRLPGRLMLPSTLPSINSDSVPVISPLTIRPLRSRSSSAWRTVERLSPDVVAYSATSADIPALAQQDRRLRDWLRSSGRRVFRVIDFSCSSRSSGGIFSWKSLSSSAED